MSIDAADLLALREPVRAILRRVAADAILPRFRELGHADVREKSPGEWVTVADHESEKALTDDLSAILPSARVVGEEACSTNESLLESVDEGLVWIVDPLDGTANFASGHAPFGIIVALADGGETLAGWLYDPLTDRLCFAARECGADLTIGSEPRRQLRTPPDPDRPTVALATQFMSAARREEVILAGQSAFDVQPIPRCAAEHYPRLCLGENHVALFQRTLPWDHAAGALLLTEAGGHVARWDGSPYRFHDDGVGILAASSARLWERAADVLLNESSLHAQGDQLLPADVIIPGLSR